MPELPVARSAVTPLAPEVVVAGWAVSGRRTSAALTITDCSPLAKVMVKATADGVVAQDIAVPLGHCRRQSWTVGGEQVPVLVVGSGPGEWLVFAPPGTQDGVVGLLTARVAGPPGELVTVLDLTHGRALSRLTGDRSVELLAKETAVDLGERLCPDGTALRTAVAGLATDVIRDDQGPVRSYLLHCERSSGQYLFDVLLEAGADLDIEVDGFRLDAGAAEPG